ncbi:DUF896 domain-containing protein [Hathewaya proteolytica]
MDYSKMEFKKVIERINELYKLSQERELTEEEKSEQKEIREYYIRVIKGNVKQQISGYKQNS